MKPDGRNRSIGELLLGFGIASLGLFIAIETTAIKVAPIYAKVGPTAIPLVIAAGLILLGALLSFQAIRRQSAAPAGPSAAGKADWRALLGISAGLWLQILLLEPAGFLISAAILFWCVAWSFGSRRFLRDGAIAILLAAIIQVGFTRGLNLQLPAGVFEGVL